MNNPTQLRRLILGLYRRVAGAALALAIALVLAVVVTGSAQAQTYSVLYSFTGGADGGYPLASLVPDTKGNLYGTTSERGAYGAGTVFKVATNRQLIVLYSFTGGADGANPYGGLVQDPQGNLYGTTNGGGAYGVGTVFKLDTNGNETVLHSFSNGPDGASPQAGLVLDTQGNLFGTTTGGGAKDWGTVFKLDPTGNETVLHSFASFDGDGSLPSSGLVMDAQGNLYGTTVEGGTHVYGTVYKIDQTGNETVLHSFTGGKPDGESPDGGVVLTHRATYMALPSPLAR